MAGDWIKMRNDLPDDPAVIAIAARLGLDEFAVIGRLHTLWAWADEQSRDGHAVGVTSAWLDRKVQRDGFADALVSVGWLEVTNDGLTIPNFENHNGETAKVRALGTRRKQRQRAGEAPVDVPPTVPKTVATVSLDVSRTQRDKSETREEKRRDIEIPLTPKPDRKLPVVSLGAWITTTKAKGEKPIPDDDPVFAYADRIALPREFLSLAWREFRGRYLEPEAKKYRDWRAVFRKAVRGNWLKLWYVAGDVYQLTTVGLQAQRLHAEKHLEAA